MSDRTVVITGIGAISAIGCSASELWRACLRGASRVEHVPEHWLRFSPLGSRLWSPLPELREHYRGIDRAELQRVDPVTAMCVTAAMQALEDAGTTVRPSGERRRAYDVLELDPRRTGVFMGTGVGGASSFAAAHAHHVLKAPLGHLNGAVQRAAQGFDANPVTALNMPQRFNPFTVSMLMPNAVSAYCGIKLGLSGENTTVTLACASGTAAIGRAFEAVRDGRLDAALAGGSEYLLDEHGSVFRGFDACRTLVRGSHDPERANRPFDEARSGFLFSQGGACVLLVETLDAARARGAVPIAEIVGFAEGFDAHGMMSPCPQGAGLRAMLDALIANAGIAPHDVDYVNAHGNGTITSDAVEVDVLEQLFGDRPVVNSTKSLLGHTMGASGALEASVTAFSLREQQVHANANLERPIGSLDFPTSSRALKMRYAVSQSLAFGGHCAGLLMRRVEA